jgi:hypothetical protein
MQGKHYPPKMLKGSTENILTNDEWIKYTKNARKISLAFVSIVTIVDFNYKSSIIY